MSDHSHNLINNNAISNNSKILNTDGLTKSNLILTKEPLNECADISKIDEIQSIIFSIIYAEKLLGLTVASSNLEYWLNGKTQSRKIDVTWLKNTNCIKEILRIHHLRFETESLYNAYNGAMTIEDGKTISLNDKIHKDISNPSEFLAGDIDLALAIGTTRLWSEGNFEITRNGNVYSIKGTVINMLKDTFDFNTGETFPPQKYLDKYINEPLGFDIRSLKADDINLLKCRTARDFQQDCSWDEHVEANGTPVELDRFTDANIWKWT